MALLSLSTIGYFVGAYLVYTIFWSFFGERISILLFPKHYEVWAGTQPPPSTGMRHQIQFIWKTWRTLKSGGDLFDDVVCPSFERDGYTVERSGGIRLFTLEPQNIQAMLATQFKDFETGAIRRGALFPALGHSIFTSDGSFWEHSRALFRSQFSRDNINDLAATEAASNALIAACGYADSTGWTEEVKLSPLFYNFTLDTATDFLFGESINSQEAAIKRARGEYNVADGAAVPTSETFFTSLELINQTIMGRFRLGSLYWLWDGFEFRRALKFIKNWTNRYAEMALNNSGPAQKESKKTNVLSTLATQCKDPNELRNQTLSILFAGRDTTASLLGWLFMRLSLNPDVYQKLRSVVLAEFPVGSELTFAGLKSCRYLQHVVNEALRLHPTIPFNVRVALCDTTLPTGGGPDRTAPIPIRKGQAVAFLVYAMHRRKDLWGEDALDFKPDRWEQRVPAWQYLPFLGGPRICLGQQFALIEASYLLVKMVQHFDKIEPVDWTEMSRMRKNIGVTMAVKDNVRVRLHKAGGV